jgi:ElaB/YqjD/DUF883 family membrane-anchored ribosome-binding protein
MARIQSSHDHIHAALKKLKDESNAKEVELIDLITSIYDSVKESEAKLIDKAKATATSLNDSVQEHPWYYIGGAALLGFLAGLFFRR